MVKEKTLKNGVRVVIKNMEGLLSVSMGILVGTGAAFETDKEDGISHFIEHMQFKGTKTRTAFEISDAFDALGAQVNAFTGKDLTCYYSKSTSDHAQEAFALLADLFLNSTFPEEEMEREKGVVVEEINMNEDAPEDLCLDLLSLASFGKANYGRNILGPQENVKGFTREDIFAYKRQRYCPQNIVVSFAGSIDPEKAIALVEQFFGEMECAEFSQRKKEVVWKGDNLFRKKPIEQAHFAFAFPSVPRDHADFAATQVMNAVLGGSMSSRLFKKVREEMGLAYSVYSYSSHYEETGAFAVYAGVNPKKAENAAEAICGVLKEFLDKGVNEDEFLRGREQLRAGNIYSQENTSSQMLLYGKEMLYRGRVYDFERRMAEISALTLDDVLRASRENIDFSKISVASVGNLERAIKA